MKKQLSLSLALGLSLFGCLVGAPMRANAGRSPIPGVTNFINNQQNAINNFINSSAGIGGGRFPLPTRIPSRFNNPRRGGGGRFGLILPPTIQSELNRAANKILEEYQDVNMLFAVVQNKALLENGESPIVDINMLNAAITDYNNIVMASSPEELRELAKDPAFIRKGKMLKELRAVLNNN
ncbi:MULTISPECIES: hypothetical protein [Cyanophyceae]|uniref:DUF4168 domain-containing protein n=2 Tax=Nodularia spumigena TaxID=70799 RepID=A0A161XLT7_NODSP|nr:MULTISPECIES: hypothetical protein [Cyanophyceae]KZL50801.1 hypothetical protein A2T98_05650 [Nodularia spumigena CENA596]MDB9318773.1 hypothetical protein [Nodularia spumigena CS-590/01A]MDB9322972.1 hypothetical protein [Nodularia spumigena CS-591/07A]MDB9328037.1 hypothetical protein [Nodularia spumigena CS-590/02]MDB9331542.1 hypothetical protein [Nodularia spumigena CS-591/04]